MRRLIGDFCIGYEKRPYIVRPSGLLNVATLILFDFAGADIVAERRPFFIWYRKEIRVVGVGDKHMGFAFLYEEASYSSEAGGDLDEAKILQGYDSQFLNGLFLRALRHDVLLSECRCAVEYRNNYYIPRGILHSQCQHTLDLF